jgi:hypothetical protein
MNKLKIFFCLILCASFFCGVKNAAGQSNSDKILVAGKNALRQSDVDKLIEFYEWGFQARFTADERAQFQAFLENDFREDAARERRSTDDIINAFAQIRVADEGVQQRTREKVISAYAAELRKRTAEPNAQLMFRIYERGRKNGEAAVSIENSDENRASSANAGLKVKDLIGKWSRSTGSGSIEDGTGKTKYGNGTTFTFEFFPDGTVEYVTQEKTLSIMQCRIESTQRARGKVTIEGDSMTMNLGPMSSVGTDSCDKQGNYKKTLEASSLTVTWRLKKMNSVLRPDNPTVLCFDGNGGEACFEKTKE